MEFRSQFFNKNYIYQKVANEQGSVLIIALMLMAVLAILGVVASNTSITEMRVAANEKNYNQTFYAADAAWQVAPALLDHIGSDAPEADVTTKVVDLSTFDTTEKKINGIPYTYTVTELGSQKAEGSGEGHREFQYQIDSTSLDPVTNKEKQKIRVVVNKIYQVGYGN